jgi:hypothetical protein
MFPCHSGVAACVETDTGDTDPDRFVDVGHQALVVSDPGDQREVSFRDTEGKICTVGFAPGDQRLAVEEDGAGHRPARVHRPEQPVPGRRILLMDPPRVAARFAAPGNLVSERKLHGLLDVLVPLHLIRRATARPLTAGHVGCCEIIPAPAKIRRRR